MAAANGEDRENEDHVAVAAERRRRRRGDAMLVISLPRVVRYLTTS
jgi:hypothetical protein